MVPLGSSWTEQISVPERNIKEVIMWPSTRSLATAFALVIVVVLAFPGMGAPFDETTRMRWSSGFGSRSFEVNGSAEFTDDDRDVKSISPGGYVRIEEGSWFLTGRS